MSLKSQNGGEEFCVGCNIRFNAFLANDKTIAFNRTGLLSGSTDARSTLKSSDTSGALQSENQNYAYSINLTRSSLA